TCPSGSGRRPPRDPPHGHEVIVEPRSGNQYPPIKQVEGRTAPRQPGRGSRLCSVAPATTVAIPQGGKDSGGSAGGTHRRNPQVEWNRDRRPRHRLQPAAVWTPGGCLTLPVYSVRGAAISSGNRVDRPTIVFVGLPVQILLGGHRRNGGIR